MVWGLMLKGLQGDVSRMQCITPLHIIGFEALKFNPVAQLAPDCALQQSRKPNEAVP